ncbi:MAG: tripartite tricarboxylate transporter permease [Deltaproteobacteria bacterium]|nr:tripartite tricarboxylate transporter permease [Deltaproteobacteria bacterium]
MDAFQHVMTGMYVMFTPMNIMLLTVGTFLGLVIGAMPGIGHVNGVAILLPLTFVVPPVSAIIFLSAIYYGAMFGGAISSILLGIPGTSTAVATTFDGRPMALKGQGDRALVAAALASFFGGTISILLFTFFAPMLADFALRFGPAESFTLMILAFSTFIGLGGDDIPKTIVAIILGLLLSTVGTDVVSGMPRLIFFDMPGFYKGINFLVIAIGIYGIGEMIWVIDATFGAVTLSSARVSYHSFLNGLKDIRHNLPTLSISSVMGFLVGVLPAAGATPGALMAYGLTRSVSKDPSKFGKGEVAGIIAPESANNAASTGALLPMLTLGIPGSPTTAILLGGMVMWGLQPGPLLFIEQPEFVWGMVASLYLGTFFAAILNLAGIPLFVSLLRVPFTILAPIIFVLALVGGYVPTSDLHDVWMMLGFGIIAYGFRKLNYPMAPLVLALVLGPLAEETLRQSLIASHGSGSIFFRSSIGATCIVLSLLLFSIPLLKRVWNKVMPKQTPA